MLANEPAYESWLDAIEWPYSYEAADEMSEDDVLMWPAGWELDE